ncbi:hypothetical protein ACP70R_030014 [Stipagrostis hirtigluma subsp. patula]
MEKGGGGGKPTTGFGFSWADEVEREEREQQQQQQEEEERVVARPQGRGAKREQQTKADPFGAARPREVVLAEKGVDWRARDRELDAAPRLRGAARARRHAAATAARTAHAGEEATSGVSLSASARRATPARRAMYGRDAAGAGRTPYPRRHADSTPPPPVTGRRDAPAISHGARGGGKRKCAGEGPGGAQQGRRVFGDLNVGAGCGSSSFRESAGRTVGIEASEAAVAEGGSRCNREPATAMAATATAPRDETAVDLKRRGRKRRKGRGSKKTEN